MRIILKALFIIVLTASAVSQTLNDDASTWFDLDKISYGHCANGRLYCSPKFKSSKHDINRNFRLTHMEETKQCTYHNPFLSFPPDSMAEYVYDSIGDTILVLIDGEKIITTIESIGWLGAALDSGIKLLLDPINETSPPKYSTFIALSDSLIHYPGIVEKFELIDDPDFEIISMAESLQVIHKEAFVRFDSLRFDKKKSERDEIGNEKTIEYRLNILNSRGYPFFGSVKTRYFTKINPKDTILCYIFAYPSENKCWRSAYNLIRTDTIWKVRTLLEPGAGSFAMTFKCVIDLNNDNIVEYIIAGPGSIGIYRFNGSKFIPLWKSPYFGT